jgi:DsbC/DsbD-like thiol-disulfide interchange protein
MRKMTALGVLILAFGASGGPGGETGSATKVKVSARAGKIDRAGKQVVILTMKIDKTWHIYANPARHADYESAQTVVKVAAGARPVEAKVAYPAGKLHVDGEDRFMTYIDSVDIPVQIQRTANEGPVEVSVRFVACDDKKCLTASTAKFTVP